MKLKKKINIAAYILALFIVLPALCLGSHRNTKNKNCSNYLSISGSSNVNRFQLENYDLDLDDFNFYKENRENSIENEYSVVEIPVKQFRCKNKLMYNDFQKLLKSSEYPEIKVHVKPAFSTFEENLPLQTEIKIELAGTTRHYDLVCEIERCGTEEFILKGQKKVKLTDFNLEPPEKVLGTIKVNNDVFINFAFRFTMDEMIN